MFNRRTVATGLDEVRVSNANHFKRNQSCLRVLRYHPICGNTSVFGFFLVIISCGTSVA
jgi:hypothetical protein